MISPDLTQLILGEYYDREAIHRIFEPESKFTRGAGTWGISGILPIRPKYADNSTKSYVFIVSYGRSQGHHQFDEGISDDGILNWQSQPQMNFESKEIQDFITHDSTQNSIHLFLRVKDRNPYQYLGRLGYLAHDPSKVNPVYFQWRLLDWSSNLSAQLDRKSKRLETSNSYQFPKPKPSILRQSKQPDYPTEGLSCAWLNKRVFLKDLDKSAFLHHGTAIPKDMIAFWDDGQLTESRKRSILLIHRNVQYHATISLDDHERARLFWNEEFSTLLHEGFPKVFSAYQVSQSSAAKTQIRFEKLTANTYAVEFISDEQIDSDNRLIYGDEPAQRPDGRSITYTATRFERDPNNRKRAIQIHGTVCAACGFDFGKTYGPIGDGFIEIHHINPLYLNEEETLIDPATDLLSLCSNCHRMIHRDRSKMLTVQELREKLR